MSLLPHYDIALLRFVFEGQGRNLLDAPLAMFDHAEFIGVGKQAALDIAIDESATKGKAEAPAQRVRPLPGQTEMED